MIIDIHGHYTTVPGDLLAFRKQQLSGEVPPDRIVAQAAGISDDAIRSSILEGQRKFQIERGTDLTIFSPIAGAMAHHEGDATMSRYWAEACNNTIHRVVQMFPENFIGVCQLPQSPGVSPENCIEELRRCVEELGFIGCNLNPDPAGGYWTDPPMFDRWWYPLYEALCDLDVPAMIHVSSSCNPHFHHTGAHYLNGDTSVFMQCVTSDIFRDFPKLRFVIPHGGGAVPYHWGRYRGLAHDLGRPILEEHLLENIFFDTCVYHTPGLELLTKVIPTKNVLFASEMIGAIRSIDPRTGHHYDDTKRYMDELDLSAEDRQAIFEDNARRVYPRLDAQLKSRGL
ncbi:amidohydrolase [Arsenicitalea aurantiaca]|uniref:Amidohydrolase n=1 Tax=Arsenicitalea aurantiaca TaxID=1783274 RepID=A0A433XL50_9HYPH|nr:amidohydrolase family protein [Arsenicitalea aurantiaca]RUT34806.1 amidohydrolase [Arsenicitalea aurantiaca]